MGKRHFRKKSNKNPENRISVAQIEFREFSNDAPGYSLNEADSTKMHSIYRGGLDEAAFLIAIRTTSGCTPQIG